MKKILFATSALVASSVAGAAFADGHAGISLSGDARIGLIYEDDGDDATDDDVVGTSRARVKFTAAGTSDSGLTFGFNFRTTDLTRDGDILTGSQANPADEGNDVEVSGNVSTRGSVFVSGSFGTLTYGDTDAAPNKRVSHVDAISLTGLGDEHEIGRSDQGAGRIRYDYDFDSFGFSISTQGDLDTVAVGASYSGDFGGTTIDFGIGYDDTVEDDARIAASLGAGFGAFGFKVAFATTDESVDTDAAVSVSYDAGDIDVAAFFHTIEGDGVDDSEAFGIGASYDLGGGLSAKAGIVQVSPDGADDIMRADFGLAMSF